ncbi:MAG TPA: SOS response-associated peptidase [Polyangiaceae bacterium]|nr:SOS response-associated peptidase [Polyangiaceae bacterium]
MCGRFTLGQGPAQLGEAFREFVFPPGLELAPRFNVAPSHALLVVPNDGARTARLMTWGFVPGWANDPKGLQVNARAETAATLPTFREAFRRRRCVVLADGFYEWAPAPEGSKAKVPWYFRVADGRPFAIAGLYEAWRGPDGVEREGVALLTVDANELVRPVHHRMPALLPRAAFDAWLAPGDADPATLSPWLRPAPAGTMRAWPVSRAVNAPKNDGPELVAPATSAVPDAPSAPDAPTKPAA